MQFLLQKKGGKKGYDFRGKVLVREDKAFVIANNFLKSNWNKKELEKCFEKKTGFYM